MGKGRVGEGEGKGTKQACRGAYPIYATPTTMTGRQTAGGRAFACHHFTTRCRRKGVRQRQLSQLCPAMHSVSSASPLPLDSYLPHPPSCFLVLPTIIASAIHSFIRAPLPAPSSIQFSSTHCSCSTRAARSTPALVAFCCHACVYTFTFTFTLRKHHFYATSNAQGFVASTAAAATRRRDGSAKSVAYFAAHLVKLFICPNPLTLLFLSHSLVYLSLPLVCLSVCSQSIKSAAPMFN